MPQYPYNDSTAIPQSIVQPTYPKQQMVYIVNSMDEASRYPGGGIFIDSQAPVIYSKQLDSSGKTIAFDTYDLVKREPDPSEEYITKAEVERLFEKYLGNRNRNNKPYKNKKYEPDEGDE